MMMKMKNIHHGREKSGGTLQESAVPLCDTQVVKTLDILFEMYLIFIV